MKTFYQISTLANKEQLESFVAQLELPCTVIVWYDTLEARQEGIKLVFWVNQTLSELAEIRRFEVNAIEKSCKSLQEIERKRQEERINRVAIFENIHYSRDIEEAKQYLRENPDYLKSVESTTSYKWYLLSLELNRLRVEITERIKSFWKCK